MISAYHRLIGENSAKSYAVIRLPSHLVRLQQGFNVIVFALIVAGKAMVVIMWNKIKPYVYSILLTLGVGGLSALLTSGNMDIYEKVKMPPLSPPSWLFPVVWTILYILMAISFARVYIERKNSPRMRRNAIAIYTLNLFFNFLWSILFFNCGAYLFSFIWLLALWIIILIMFLNFFRTDTAAGILLIPYILWVTFAGYLNLAIYVLNK